MLRAMGPVTITPKKRKMAMSVQSKPLPLLWLPAGSSMLPSSPVAPPGAGSVVSPAMRASNCVTAALSFTG